MLFALYYLSKNTKKFSNRVVDFDYIEESSNLNKASLSMIWILLYDYYKKGYIKKYSIRCQNGRTIGDLLNEIQKIKKQVNKSNYNKVSFTKSKLISKSMYISWISEIKKSNTVSDAELLLFIKLINQHTYYMSYPTILSIIKSFKLQFEVNLEQTIDFPQIQLIKYMDYHDNNNILRNPKIKTQNNLISFSKQVQEFKNIINDLIINKGYEVNDVVIRNQTPPDQRMIYNTDKILYYLNDDRIRILDCIIYLEYKNELTVRDFSPDYFVLDVTNLNQNSIEQNRIQLGELSLTEGQDTATLKNTTTGAISVFNLKKMKRLSYKFLKILMILKKNPKYRNSPIPLDEIKKEWNKDNDFELNPLNIYKDLSSDKLKQLNWVINKTPKKQEYHLSKIPPKN